ncbi:tetratricopeptide repeat protein [bacterium]|nr:tetratricopeptide repeat protein [bacterium]
MTGQEFKEELTILKTPKEKIELLLSYSLELRNINPKLGLKFLAKAEQLIVKTNSQENLAQSYYNKGILNTQLSNYELAFEQLSQALKISQETKNKNYECMILVATGNLYWYQGDFTKSMDYFVKGSKIAQKTKNMIVLANSLNSIASVYTAMEDFNEAINYQQKNLRIRKKLNDKNGLAICLHNIGVIYLEKNKLDLAMNNFLKSLSFFEENNNKKMKALCLTNIASCYLRLNNYNKALDYCFKIEELEKEIGNNFLIARNLRFIALIYCRLNDFDKSLFYSQQSLKINSKFNDKQNLIDIYVNLSEICRKKKNFAKSVSYLNKALSIADEIQVCCFYLAIYEGFYLTFKESGNFKEAVKNLKLLRQTEQNLINTKAKEFFKNLELDWKTEKTRKQQRTYQFKNVKLIRKNEKLEQTKQKLIESEKTAVFFATVFQINYELEFPLNHLKTYFFELEKIVAEKFANEEEPKAMEKMRISMNRFKDLLKKLQGIKKPILTDYMENIKMVKL